MLFQCFVSETGRKYGCLVDFVTTSLLTMRAYKHAHRCSLFKTDRLLINRFIWKRCLLFIQIKRSTVRWGFCVQCCFIAVYTVSIVCGFITSLWSTVWLIMVGCGIP